MTSAPIAELRDAFVRCRDMDAPLGKRLDAYSDTIRKLIPDYANAVDRLVSRLQAGQAGAGAPQPGEPMPPFILPDETGRLVSLADLTHDGPAAITFHRGHWCPWCRISAGALAALGDDLGRLGARAVAITPERQEFSAQFKSDTRSPFPVLSDLDNGYALSLDLAIWVGPDLERLLASYGRPLPAYQGNDAWLVPIPATFVVGRDGVVAARFVDPDFRRRATIEQLITALEAA